VGAGSAHGAFRRQPERSTTLTHDAFISYSHTADGKLAPAIQSGLKKLAKSNLKLRAMDVFRDQTSLAANPGLWNGIVDHLGGSRWFLLMASPESANSTWCNKEILWWLENRGPDKILVILTDGEIYWDAIGGDFDWSKTSALSPLLKGRLRDEPLYVDLRWARGREKLTLSDSRFRSAVLDLAAPIRGVPKDQLDGEDVWQLRRNKIIARSAVAAIVAAAVFAMWQAVEAVQQRDRALSRQLAAQASELRVSEPVISRLLGAQGLTMGASTEVATALLRVLRAAPFEHIVEGPETLQSLALAGDGRSAVVGDGAGATNRIDLGNGRVTALLPPQSGAILRATLSLALALTVGRWPREGLTSRLPSGGTAARRPRSIPDFTRTKGLFLGLHSAPMALRSPRPAATAAF
jgi:hypothetical protein